VATFEMAYTEQVRAGGTSEFRWALQWTTTKAGQASFFDLLRDKMTKAGSRVVKAARSE
jgi:hypothetical protein